MTASARRISEHLDFLKPGLSRKRTPPRWPPDVFAISASLLQASGAYRVAASDWPPTSKKGKWIEFIQRIGEQWRSSYTGAPPREVNKWWSVVMANKNIAMVSICNDKALSHALLQLMAAADEACVAAGVPTPPAELDDFDFAAGVLLHKNGGTTLCQDLAESPVRVLPKMHVPQNGLTIRSFSMHLALIVGNEVAPKWFNLGSPKPASELKLLVIPWPMRVSAADFHAVERKKSLMRNLPRAFGFFEFRHPNGSDFASQISKLFQDAHRAVGQIDALILPECAMSDTEYDEINSILLSQGVYLIAGVNAGGNGTVGNCVRYNIPLVGHEVPVRQPKHHRWKIESSQIETYRLGKQLNLKRSWWEHIPIEDRTINFVAFRPWLAMCVLVCEDLARPDPVGDVLRAVGPNLVIALLLDGPQIPSRWPGRYATVLAEDPGCSVLTLTSLGMAQMSRPRYKRGFKEHLGKIALWKDVTGKTESIDLKAGDSAVLHIKIDKREEWTADGRTSGRVAGYPLLHEVLALKKGRIVKRHRLS